jgi:hypothetical protein
VLSGFESSKFIYDLHKVNMFQVRSFSMDYADYRARSDQPGLAYGGSQLILDELELRETVFAR